MAILVSRSRSTPLLSALVMSLVLNACTVGPEHERPNLKLPDRWVEAEKTPSVNTEDLTQWWRGFNDPVLNSLIEQALVNNPDLKAAQLRITTARAQTTATSAGKWPVINSSTAYQRQRISPNALLGALGSIQNPRTDSAGLLSSVGPIDRPFDLFQAGFDASWELDLFGGIQRQTEAATAQAEMTRERLHDTQITLVAEVARHYLELLGLQARLAIFDDRLQSQQQVFQLTAARYREGMGDAFELQKAKRELATLESSKSPLLTQVKNTRHALALLLGKHPGELDQQLAKLPVSIPSPPPVQPGLPADLVRRRPDIREAERNVAAASALIGAAVAELFPKISLTGAAGFQSQDLGNLTHLSSGFYGFGPRLSLPIFQAGRLKANVQAQEAQHQEAIVNYEKSVLAALREVEDGLASLHGSKEQKRNLEDAAEAATKAFQTARAFYAEGQMELQDVLAAQRDLQDSREQLAQSQLLQATAHVALVKALGGGW